METATCAPPLCRSCPMAGSSRHGPHLRSRHAPRGTFIDTSAAPAHARASRNASVGTRRLAPSHTRGIPYVWHAFIGPSHPCGIPHVCHAFVVLIPTNPCRCRCRATISPLPIASMADTTFTPFLPQSPLCIRLQKPAIGTVPAKDAGCNGTGSCKRGDSLTLD